MSKLSDLIRNSLSGTLSIEKDFSFGFIHNYKAQEIKALTNADCKGAEIIITSYDIAHIFKGHGNDKLEKERGQIGVLPEDIELINEIIFEYDSVRLGKEIRNTKSIIFKKRIGVEYTIIVTIQGKIPAKKMVVKTMFKKP